MRPLRYIDRKLLGCVRTYVLTLGSLALASSGLFADTSAQLIRPQQREPLWIRVPAEIQHLIDADEVAKVAIRLDETGEVTDWIALPLPHYKLWDSVENSIAYMKFSPALLDGNPTAVDMVIEIPVGQVRYYGVIALDPRIYLETRIASMVPNRDQLTVTNANDLDNQLKIISRGKTVIPVDPDGNHLKGEVDVEFFVDINGRPRLINSDESLHPVVRNAAYMTVEQFSFNKPSIKGRPTVTKAKILIKY